MAQTRITKRWLKTHWTYSWWKYLLLVCLCIMGVNILFTTTAYRVPDEKKIELYVTNFYVDQTAMKADLEPLFFQRHPEQEELTVVNINLAMDDPYVRMQFSTYIGAQQGDVLLLTKAELLSLAGDEADNFLLDLTPYMESGALDPLDAEQLVLPAEDGTMGVYAIAADSLGGLGAFGNDPSDSYLCVTGYCGNEETAVSVLDMLIERYQGENPLHSVPQPEAPSVLF